MKRILIVASFIALLAPAAFAYGNPGAQSLSGSHPVVLPKVGSQILQPREMKSNDQLNQISGSGLGTVPVDWCLPKLEPESPDVSGLNTNKEID